MQRVLKRYREFRAVAGSGDGPVALVVPVDGDLPPGRAVQADLLKERCGLRLTGSRAADLLSLDTAAGRVQLGLGVLRHFAGPGNIVTPWRSTRSRLWCQATLSRRC
jgi:hypothetical protein